MSVNLVSINEQIRQNGDIIVQRERQRQDRIRLARELFTQYASEVDFLQDRVSSINEGNRNIRCAKPLVDNLDVKYPSHQPEEIDRYSVMAADGSQIIPDRHRRVEFGLINVCIMKLDANRVISKPQKISELMFPDVSATPSDNLSEELIALKRNTRERQLLAELAARESSPVVALTDGPLELFREPQQGKQHQQFFQQYLENLTQLTKKGGISAGYVDRPKADLIVRLLELATLKNDELSQANQLRPLQGVTDTALLDGVLMPGERSALFSLESSSARLFKEHDQDIAIHFFYINTGKKQAGEDSLVRIEIPAGISGNASMIDVLHHVILEQCKKMGTSPYPYLLHRAHEEALVTFKESMHIEDMIISSLLSKGLGQPVLSNKQFLKNLTNH